MNYENPLDARMVTIRYTNYRGETAIRRIIPLQIRFIATEWHPAEQWIIEAYDIDRGEDRSFAMKDILEWNVLPPHSSSLRGIGSSQISEQSAIKPANTRSMDSTLGSIGNP